MNSTLNQPHILQQHRAPLETSIAASAPGRERLASDLYLAAADTLANRRTEHPLAQCTRALLVATRNTPALIVATATDPESGYFVQLIGDGQTAEAQLIFGRKFIAEHKVPSSSSSMVKIWR